MDHVLHKHHIFAWIAFTFVFFSLFLTTVSYDLQKSGSNFTEVRLTGMVISDELDLQVGDILSNQETSSYWIVTSTNKLAKLHDGYWIVEGDYFSGGFVRSTTTQPLSAFKLTKIHESMPAEVKDTLRAPYFSYYEDGKELTLEKAISSQ